MQLFVYITNQENCIPPILAELTARGIQGATVVDSKGMIKSVAERSAEPPPIFGSLRKFIDPEFRANKMLFIVLRDEDVATVKSVVHGVVGDLEQPSHGVLFTTPVMSWEGVSSKKK